MRASAPEPTLARAERSPAGRRYAGSTLERAEDVRQLADTLLEFRGGDGFPPVWQANTIDGAEAVAGNLVYAAGFNDDIEVRRLSDGSVVANVPLPAGDPFFRAVTPSAGRLYIVTNTKLTALAPA